ncbi:PIN-like domain-containing protein [Bacillus safensis]|uniref:PIN-like domain-containing protein n=1 Tax=Bacillus safensis TaxID=561879 RepID=UPI002280F2AD|nr:PIN-like domain-containing protein [Bacillus safensis]MCY7433226.1 PIN-like domain-containing protein [Bacillus safensis]MED0867119.1 PIN-like domain-containing protein [Bacillus safensis]
MEQWKQYFYQPEPISEWIKEATIVIDTNLLLAAYQWRELTFSEVLKVLEKLKKEKRLKIPLQVIEEFSRNRPKQIMQRINDINTIVSKLNKDNKTLQQKLPMLHETDDLLKQAEESRVNYNKAIDNYNDSLGNLKRKLENLFFDDPILKQIENICEGIVISPDKDLVELEKEGNERFKNNIPPGHKDKTKEENKYGDYIIWATILELKEDVVFVSSDEKKDWLYSNSKNSSTLVAKRELTEEFNNKNNKRFAHITPKILIDLINPNVSDEVKEDLENIKMNDVFSVKREGIMYIYNKIHNLIETFREEAKISYTSNVMDSLKLLHRDQLISKELYLKLKEIFNRDAYSNSSYSTVILKELQETYRQLMIEYYEFSIN